MPISIAEAEAARRNIAGMAIRTPLVRCNAETDLHLKLESLQPIGSFKIRGAANAMALLPRERLDGSVLPASARNIAPGAAFCPPRLGIAATIAVPQPAP